MSLKLAVEITGNAAGLTRSAAEAAAAVRSMDAAVRAAGVNASSAAAGINQATTASAAMASQTAAAAQRMAASAAAGGRSGSAQGAAAAAAGGFRPDQWKNLGFQANDVLTSLFGGAPITQVIAQQGGQVAQVLGEAPGGIAGGLKIVASRALSILTPLRLVTGGFAGLAAGVAYLGVQWANSQTAIEQGLTGIGAMSRATVGDINRIAEAAANGGLMSSGASRGVATAVASTGKVDASNIGAVTALAPGYAQMFSKSIGDAGDDLARIFSDPVKGAAELNERIGGLDARTKAYVQTLVDQGNRQEAIRVVVRAFGPELDAAANKTSAWAKAWNTVASAAEAAGRFVARPFVAGSTQEQIDALTAELKARQDQVANPGPNDPGGETAAMLIPGIKAQIAKLTAQFGDEQAAPAKKASAELSQQADDAVRAISPEIAIVKTLTDRIVLLQKAQGDAAAANALSMSAEQVASALDKETSARETFMTAGEKARASEELTIRTIQARTVAERAAIAAERERLELAGAEVGANDRRQQIEAARTAVLAQSTRDSEDRLRAANDNAASAGLPSYQKQVADLEAKYRRQFEEDSGNTSASKNDQLARAAERAGIDKEAVAGPLRDANRALAEQVAALKLQQDSFGASTEAAGRMSAAQQLVNQYTAAGIPITADLKRQIDTYAASAGKVAAAADEVAKKQQNIVGGLDDVRSGLRGGFTGIFSDPSKGQSPLDGVKNSLNGIASGIFDRTVSQPLTNGLLGDPGKAGGGLFGGAVGSIFGKSSLSTADITAGIVNVNGSVAGASGLASAVAGGGAGSIGGAGGVAGSLLGANGRLDPQAGFAYLRSKGMNDAQAAAVLGNFRQESGLNPTIVNSKENAFGLDQLRNDRLTGLNSYASSQGVSANDPKTQLDFMMREMRTTEAGNSSSFLNATDVAGANAGLKKFIRYGDDSQGTRLGYSQDYLKQFGGSSPAPAATAATPAVTSLNTSLQSINSSAASASQGVGSLAGNLTSLPAPLAQTSQGLTQVGSSLGSGGGGLLGALSNLFGGGSSAAAPATVTAAGGGHITGPGTGTSDSILARLSNGEFVFKASATKRIGLSNLHAMNEGRMPAFAEGGLVTGTAVPPAARQASDDRDTATSRAAARAGEAPVEFHLHDNVGVAATSKTSRTDRGGQRIDVMLGKLIANELSTPGSASAQALQQHYNLRRTPVRR